MDIKREMKYKESAREWSVYFHDKTGGRWLFTADYTLGGYSYFTSTKIERGYRAVVFPFTMNVSDGSCQYVLDFGAQGCAVDREYAPRFSKKTLDAFAKRAWEHVLEMDEAGKFEQMENRYRAPVEQGEFVKVCEICRLEGHLKEQCGDRQELERKGLTSEMAGV